MTPRDNLKPCPFCGSEAVISVSRDGDVCNVRCAAWEPVVCLGAGPNTYSESTAIAAWNTRNPPADPPSVEREVLEAIKRGEYSELPPLGDSRISPPAVDAGVREGIYIASKTKHADRWRFLRDKIGEPIISTWIDEAGEGESKDLHDLWRRCIAEASSCRVLIVYREGDEVLKGGWVEVGAALAVGTPVYAVGLEGFTIANYRGITHFPDMKSAVAASRKLKAARASHPLVSVEPGGNGTPKG